MSLHLLHNPNTMATHSQNGSSTSNGSRHTPFHPVPTSPLSWLDLRVFYIRIIKCDITDDSTPEHLTLNHVPLTRDTLLEVNNVRTSIYSDGVTTLLRRDRIDKKSEEVTFVSTDSVRTTGSVKFEVFDNDVLLVSGVFDLCDSNGPVQSNGYISNGYIPNGYVSNGFDLRWRMECETDVVVGNGFLKGKGCDIEVCCAGSFGGKPIILTKTLQVGCRKKKKGVLEAIPENESMASEEEGSSSQGLKVQEYRNYQSEQHEHLSLYSGLEYIENEDGELSWFNAGVRVGVGIGLSVCLGMGIGVGLLVRTYQRTTRNFTRRLL